MIPLRDDVPTRIAPTVTISLVALNVAAFLYELSLGPGRRGHAGAEAFITSFGVVPRELLAPRVSLRTLLTPLTSMFLHGGFLHIGGNMLYLWIFGNNVEDSMGRVRFVVFYLMCGIAAALAQVVMDPSSNVPVVGASGAISGVMGAYLILYPRVRVYTLVPLGFFLTTIALPAWAMLGYWIVLQFLGALPAVAGAQAEAGVAFWAHIGGFIVGAATIRLFARSDYLNSRRQNPWAPQRVRWG
ncbi:MAG TPA: rhomboid family intramembrane serine protease [Deltaproteobacteria bacterium]|nr:rhomboid family intramembrane serine protease [Deltaproteobacteria bacterium]